MEKDVLRIFAIKFSDIQSKVVRNSQRLEEKNHFLLSGNFLIGRFDFLQGFPADS